MRLAATLGALLVACATAHASETQQQPSVLRDLLEGRQLATCTPGISWKVGKGNILLNGKAFHLRGASWFGFETPLSIVHGVWGSTTMTKVLDFCNANKINALRIPISLDMALNPDTAFQPSQCMECPTTKSWDALDRLFDLAAAKGVLIMLDMHNLNKNNGQEVWTDAAHTEADLINGWAAMVGRYNGRPNFFGIDLINEPHGRATWGMGQDTDWNKAAERIVKGIVAKVPGFNKLIVVEGVGALGAPTPLPADDPANNQFWGANLQGVYKAPIDFGSADLNARLIYSPHIYGPAVAYQPYFGAADFPNNMPAIWDKQFGFVEKLTGKPIMIGEWGGPNTGADGQLQGKLAAYLADKCMGDQFYWTINPNSGDTKGLLEDDWTTPADVRIALIKAAQPDPSVFTAPITATNVCLTYGSFAGRACGAYAPPTTARTCAAGGKLNPLKDVCCPAFCKQCGGLGCGTAENGGANNCCRSGIRANKPKCSATVLPPCKIF